MPKANLYQLCRNDECPNYPAATEGFYCDYCGPIMERHRNREHYRGDYKTRAKRVVDAARMQPTKCGLCPDLLLPYQEIQAHHIIDGDKDSELVATHSYCNLSKGNTST